MKLKAISASLFLLGLSAPAFSNDVYVGIGVGDVDYDINGLEDPTGVQLFGGTKVNENVGFEVFYTDFGDADSDAGTLNATNFGAGALLGAEVAPNANLFVSVGLHAWDSEFDSDTFLVPDADDSGSDLYFGFGGSFGIGDAIAIGARYNSYEVDDEDVSLLSLTFQVNLQ